MTTETTTEPYKRDVALAVPRRHDIDLHVSHITVGEDKYVDIREFIPSLQQYGRGVLIPMRLASQIGEEVLQMGEAWDKENEPE